MLVCVLSWTTQRFSPRRKENHKQTHFEHVQEFGSTTISLYDDEIPIGYAQVAPYHVIERYDTTKDYIKLTQDYKNQRQWRIACMFIDKDYRKQHYASTLFLEACDYIAQTGGGWVEVFPFIQEGDKQRFDFNGSVAFYTKHGFEEVSQLGKSTLLMRKYIRSISTSL
jgi:GNAT superfamily N-acetyltransferase